MAAAQLPGSRFSGNRRTSFLPQPVRFEGNDYFEIHDMCVSEAQALSPDFGDYQHKWRSCIPTDIISGLCNACRQKPESEQCRFQRISSVTDWRFKMCCAHFKLYMLKAGSNFNFEIKSNRKLVCPLHEALPQICDTPLREQESILEHIYRNHFNHLRPQDFYCLSISNVFRVVLFEEEEAFLYYKLVEDGNLIVGMARVGLSKKAFIFVVTFWYFSEIFRDVREDSHTFVVPFLHECTINLIYQELRLKKSLRQLSKFINAERNEIRMSVHVMVTQ